MGPPLYIKEKAKVNAFVPLALHTLTDDDDERISSVDEWLCPRHERPRRPAGRQVSRDGAVWRDA
ncbi:MAG: hypothetical protein ACLGHP_01865, partial [Vicinamibacteria bacterium]